MSAANRVFAVPLLADKIFLQLPIRDALTCRRVSHTFLDAITNLAPVQRMLFVQPETITLDPDFTIVGAKFPSLPRSQYFVVPVSGGRTIKFRKQSMPMDIMRTIMFTQPPCPKVRLTNGIGWEASLVDPAGVKLWEVMRQVGMADRRYRVNVYVPQGSRVVVESL